MSFAIALTDEQWELVADLFAPPGRRGAPAQILGLPLAGHAALHPSAPQRLSHRRC